MTSVVAGLGNPGRMYIGTRHNVGFNVVDEIAGALGARFVEGKGQFFIARASRDGKQISLVKPTTYMNNSGLAIRELLEREVLESAALLVVYDDFHLPLGTLRLRMEGTDGGHNGMASIIYQLGTSAIARLRCGIRGTGFPENPNGVVDYVLSPFEKGEVSVAREMVVRARDAVQTILDEGFECAMNRFNS